MGGNLVAKVLGDAPARKIVDRLLNDAKHETKRLLTDHRHLVAALRDALCEREELIGDDILEVLREAEASALDEEAVVVDLRVTEEQPARHPDPTDRIELVE